MSSDFPLQYIDEKASNDDLAKENKVTQLYDETDV